MTETAVETLRARGEPARYERLLGEILVGLDRAGQLRRPRARRREPERGRADAPPAIDDRPSDDRRRRHAAATTADATGGRRRERDARRARRPRRARAPAPRATRRAGRDRGRRGSGRAPDPVERLLALIRDELAGRPSGA